MDYSDDASEVPATEAPAAAAEEEEAAAEDAEKGGYGAEDVKKGGYGEEKVVKRSCLLTVMNKMNLDVSAKFSVTKYGN